MGWDGMGVNGVCRAAYSSGAIIDTLSLSQMNAITKRMFVSKWASLDLNAIFYILRVLVIHNNRLL